MIVGLWVNHLRIVKTTMGLKLCPVELQLNLVRGNLSTIMATQTSLATSMSAHTCLASLQIASGIRISAQHLASGSDVLMASS